MNGPLPLKRYILLALTLLLIPLAVYFYLLRVPSMAPPIRIQVSGLPQRMLDENLVKIIMYSQQRNGFYVYRIESTPYWSSSVIWIKDCFIQIAEKTLAQIEHVEITIGNEKILYDQAALQKMVRMAPHIRLNSDQYGPGDVLLVVPTTPLHTSSLPWQADVPWNWPGDNVFLRSRSLLDLSVVACGAAGLHVSEESHSPGTYLAAIRAWDCGSRAP